MNASNLSPTDLANAATAARREAQIRHALSRQANQPGMVRTIDQPPSEQELARQRNARIRRLGNSSSDFRSQLTALAQESDAIRARLAGYSRQRADALREGRMGEAKSLSGRVEIAELELEQFALLQQDAEAGLAAAEEREARERDALRAQISAAEKTVSAHCKALKDEFPKLAARLREIYDLEAQSDAAFRLLREAEMKISEYSAPTPTGPRLRGAMIIPGYIERPKASFNIHDVYTN